MQNNLPFLRPGQRIIVRHHANGDTEYICRQDDGTVVTGGCFNFLFWLAVAAFVLLVIFSDATREFYENRGRVRENDELNIVDR